MKNFSMMVALLLVIGVVAVLSNDTAFAQPLDQIQTGVDAIGGSDSASAESTIKTIVNTLLYLIGAVAVIMLVYGGFKYMTSGGDSAAVASAKNTVLYAVVGLVVAILAFSISNFVVGTFTDSDGESAAPPACVEGGNNDRDCYGDPRDS